VVRSHQGVNIPAERLRLPPVTERDRAILADLLALRVDLVAQSFVRSPSDVAELRAAMGEDRPVPIVAKIETRPAVEDFAGILAVSDAVMVARGDLGVELPMEEIPLVQKRLLTEARSAGRPVIVATQMLESMIRSPRPTRAEANDVATAVLDGADAIMLSAETAVGDFPFEAASAASRIAEAAETQGRAFRAGQPDVTHSGEAAAVAHAAASIVAGAPEVVAITCYTTTGRTAALLAAERPDVPIHAFIPDAEVRRANGLLWGVNALPAERPSDTDAMIAMMDAGLRDLRLAAEGEVVVMAASMPAGRTTTNMLKVHLVGSMA
jgi:pyruvate kinase